MTTPPPTCTMTGKPLESVGRLGVVDEDELVNTNRQFGARPVRSLPVSGTPAKLLNGAVIAAPHIFAASCGVLPSRPEDRRRRP